MTKNSHLQDVVAVDSARLPGYIILFGGGLPPLKKMYCRDHEKGEEHTQTHRQTRQVGELIMLYCSTIGVMQRCVPVQHKNLLVTIVPMSLLKNCLSRMHLLTLNANYSNEAGLSVSRLLRSNER
jgi:hypothetical protein